MEETGGDETTAMQIRIPAFLFSIKISFGIPAAEGGRRRLGGGERGIDSSQSPRSIKATPCEYAARDWIGGRGRSKQRVEKKTVNDSGLVH